ncbi:hypothetical protein LR961_18470 [Stenotrophomonas sp. SY1]|nr:hypothetical protein [Stenotrophomonas sp. SY1]
MSKQRTQTREDLIRDNERMRTQLAAMRTSRLSSNVTAILKHLIKYGSIATAVVLSIRYLAGQVTVVDAAVDLCASFKDLLEELAPKWWVQLVTVAIYPFFWRAYARLRRINSDHVQKLSQRTVENETAMDPNRSSSGLGKDGETHERDKI